MKAGIIRDWNPSFGILDLLVRYYSPHDLAQFPSAPSFDDLPAPKEAGTRCSKLLIEEVKHIKTLIFTVLDYKSSEFVVLNKGNDEAAEKLVEFLKNSSATSF